MTPRTVSLRAFLLAMAGTTVGLAATAALMRRDFEASQAIVGSLLLVWCVGLVIAVAICSGRRRTIALAALAATCIHWRLAALSPTFVYYQSDFVTFTLLRGFWWWSGAETALIDQGSPALARFIENGLALASIWLGVLAGLVAWFGLRPYQEAPSVSHLNDASSKQSRVALVTEGESPAPRRVNCARVAKGALAFLLATIASIAVLVCRPLYVIPGGCGLLTIWCVGLIVATACSPRWRVPAAATLAATCLHWQFAGFSAVEGFYDLPSNWLADRFSDAWDPQAGLDAPDRTKEFDRFDSHDEYLAYWYAHDQYGAANDGQRSLAAALASMWLGIIVGLIVVWRRSTLHAFLDSPRDAGESSEEIRSSVGANQHRARRAYWIAGLVTALAGAFFALALGPDYFQPWFWLGMMAWLIGAVLVAATGRSEQQVFALALFAASWMWLEIECHYGHAYYELSFTWTVCVWLESDVLLPLHDSLVGPSAKYSAVDGGRLSTLALGVWVGVLAGTGAWLLRRWRETWLNQPSRAAVGSRWRRPTGALLLAGIALVAAVGTEWCLTHADGIEGSGPWLSAATTLWIATLSAVLGRGSPRARTFAFASLVAFIVLLNIGGDCPNRDSAITRYEWLGDRLYWRGWNINRLFLPPLPAGSEGTPQYEFTELVVVLLLFWASNIVGLIAWAVYPLGCLERKRRGELETKAMRCTAGPSA